MKRFLILVTGAVAVGFTGCASKTPTEASYGQAVREMISAQVADPTTLTNPSTAPVTGADPDMVNNAINAMRSEVAKPADVKRDIVVKLGRETVAGVDDLVRLLDGSRVDQSVAMTVLRFGKLLELTVRPIERPSAA